MFSSIHVSFDCRSCYQNPEFGEDAQLRQLLKHMRLYDEFQKNQLPSSPTSSLTDIFSKKARMPQVQNSENEVLPFQTKKITTDLKKAPLTPPLKRREIQEIVQAITEELRSNQEIIISSQKINQLVVRELKKRGNVVQEPPVKLESLENLVSRGVSSLISQDRALLVSKLREYTRK